MKKLIELFTSDSREEGLEYTLNKDGKSYSITDSIIRTNTDIIIPYNYKELPITSIGDWSFSCRRSLTSIILPNSITSIGDNAFVNCNSLTYIIIPDTVINIGQRTFAVCLSLTNITIPNSVTIVRWSTFAYCKSLTNITIPNSVISIEDDAFYNCTSLTNINYNGTIVQWYQIRLANSWDVDTPNYTIHCTDGDIKKDGTIIRKESGGK